MGGIVCDDSEVNGRKYENLLQFNTTRFFFYKQCFFQFNFRVA